jgi:hypothetical protein
MSQQEAAAGAGVAAGGGGEETGREGQMAGVQLLHSGNCTLRKAMVFELACMYDLLNYV